LIDVLHMEIVFEATLPHALIEPDLSLDLGESEDSLIGRSLFAMRPERCGEVELEEILNHEETIRLCLLSTLTTQTQREREGERESEREDIKQRIDSARSERLGREGYLHVLADAYLVDCKATLISFE
jgi:hypothetical protein